MEFREVVAKRRMVRRYDPDRAVPEDVLKTVLRHATRAPSAGFTQGWNFIILSSPEQRQSFWDATADPDAEPDNWLAGIQAAPTLIVCCSDKGAYLDRYAEPDKGWTDRDEARWPVPYWDIDTGMAALLMLLTAVDEGLGALFFGVPPAAHDDVHRALAIPHNHTIVGIVSIGYAMPDIKSPSLKRGRRSTEQVVHYGQFGQFGSSATLIGPD